MNPKILTIGFVALMGAAGLASGLEEVQLTALRGYVEEVRKHYGVPGAAVAVVQGGRVAWAGGFGLRGLGSPVPVDENTLFQIGSTTKSMTALMLATLVDEGKLSWDTKVRDLLPGFRLSDPHATANFRVRDLMNNASGLGRNDLAWIGLSLSVPELLDTLALQPFSARPGERYGYSNLLWAASGFAGAAAAGLPASEASYRRLMHERVFRPIGMRSATTEAVPASPNRAMPHLINLLGELSEGHYAPNGALLPAGFVSASARDMGLYLLTQIAGGVASSGERVVSQANLAETWRPGVEIPADSAERTLFLPKVTSLRYGMGWMTETYKGLEVRSHGGSTDGFTAEMAWVPSMNAGIVVLSNRLGAFNFTMSVRYRWLELLMGWPAEKDAIYKAREAAFSEQLNALGHAVAQQPSAEAFSPLIGEYSQGVRLVLRNNLLWLKRGYLEAPLVALGERTFLVGGSSLIGSTIEFASDGSATLKAGEQAPLVIRPLSR